LVFLGFGRSFFLDIGLIDVLLSINFWYKPTTSAIASQWQYHLFGMKDYSLYAGKKSEK
jgi:hypothetical protein